jgi:hypothetical protein
MEEEYDRLTPGGPSRPTTSDHRRTLRSVSPALDRRPEQTLAGQRPESSSLTETCSESASFTIVESRGSRPSSSSSEISVPRLPATT